MNNGNLRFILANAEKPLKISEEIKFTRGDGMYENILIIEDDRVIRDELVQFLENAEYKTTVPNLDGNVTDTVKKVYIKKDHFIMEEKIKIRIQQQMQLLLNL